MKVIGVVGYPASGKGEFSNIAEKLGIPVVVMGDLIRRRVTAAGLAITDENTGAEARRLRERFGMEAVAILTAEEIRKQGANVVVIDGIRGDAEVRYFQSMFADFRLVAIEAAFAVRLGRMQSRGRSDDTVTAEGLIRRDERENSFGLATAMALAQTHLGNEPTLEAYEATVRRFFAEGV
ncbi:MAG: flagellar hook-basal body complex protein FliE [Methanocalculaceae archaeon]|nr:flagellar hook-basal body complex protein FliE [Methanocalculaceae archaeon]